MNITIWFEVTAAAILLVFVLYCAVQHLREAAPERTRTPPTA
jgi:hypothetical protein